MELLRCALHSIGFPQQMLLLLLLLLLLQADVGQLYASPAMQLGQHSLQPLLDEAADINRLLSAAGY
jgi:hypothetical protein